MRVLVLVLCLSSLAVAETNQERGKRIVDDALAAAGGKSFLAMQDRVETGRAFSFYREQLSGLTIAHIYTRYLTRPEPPKAGFFGVREREAFGRDQDSAVLFNENGDGWDITFRGARPILPPILTRFRESTMHNIFYILRMRLGEPGLNFFYSGSDVWNNQPVYKVDIEDADNRQVTVFFNQSTKLPVKQTFFRRDPDTKDRIEEVAMFSKYRDVGGGVMWPFTIQRERNGEKIYEIFSDSVTINGDLNDKLFTLPATVKILKNKP